jgi:phosphatidate cytidylyltransferase
MCLVGSAIAQIGDFAASCIKRDCNVKDYGFILPGHGGFMDRFDSVIFIAPVVYYVVMYFPTIISYIGY